LGKCVFSISLISIFFSNAFGIWIVINRLKDFRLTTRTARKREAMLKNEKTEEEVDKELATYRVKSKELGETTWILFWWQIGSFSAGVSFLAFSVLAIFGQKLL
jgi:hypothetical protein